MLRLLIVDDEVIVRKWLTLVFQPFDKEFVAVSYTHLDVYKRQ